MKKITLVSAIILLIALFFSGCGGNKTGNPNPVSAEQSEKELRAANDQLYAALNAMFTGDLESMNAIWSHDSIVTDMGPFGGRLEGWGAVGSEFQKEAGMKLGGKVVCEELLVHAGTDMGYTVCIEQGENMDADGKPVTVRHRATNVFRKEKGKWKLVHHHTDLSPDLMKATGTEMK